MYLLWMAAALAQPVEEPTSEEIVVEEEAVERARQAVIQELEELGYDRLVERDGRVVLKHRDTWKGKIVLFDDGYLRHERQGFRIVEGPATELPKGTRWLPCIVVPTACVRSGLTVGKRKLDGQKHRTMRAIEPELRELGDRLADASVAEVLLVLPDRLAALWEQGTPLEGGSPLTTYRARRNALLEFWESRTATDWGWQVRDAVEAFTIGVVQASDHPFTKHEVARFNARTSASRPFPYR